MNTASANHFDIVVIGAGMAGASVAFELAPHGRVAVAEMEDQPGYHTTGRSAAIFSETYGPAPIRALTGQSRRFFETPPQQFGEVPLLSPRRILHIARDNQGGQLEALFQTIGGQLGVRRVDRADIALLVPLLRPDHATAGLLEEGAYDIDVNALHQGYLRGVRRRGGVVLPGAGISRLERGGGVWTLHAGDYVITAAIVVNAAGAWADEIGAKAGAAAIGLVPKRRTIVIADTPPGVDAGDWPAVGDVDDTFYLKPDSGRLMLSPADETPSAPCDAQPDEMDVAICVDRIEQAFDFKVQRIENRWAGLRSFVADRAPVCGFDPDLAGFFWLAGQGGYGIQSAPALAQLAAALITGAALPEGLTDRGFEPDSVSPLRLDRHSARQM